MQAGIQRKVILPNVVEISRDLLRIEDHVPAMPGNRRGDQDKEVVPKKGVPERLLSRSVGPRHQPVRIRDVRGVDDMEIRHVDHARGCEDVPLRVEGPEPLVDRDLQDRRRRGQRRVDCPCPSGIPAAADQVGPFLSIGTQY